MALIPSNWAAALQAEFESVVGMTGPATLVWSSAIAEGTIDAIKLGSFVTSGVGAALAPGVGIGAGVTGLSASALAADMNASGVIIGDGPKLPFLFLAISTVFVNQMLLADLTSTSTVNPGTETIVPGTINVSGAGMSAAIQSYGVGMDGPAWPLLCSVIGNTCAAHLLQGTGTLIVGAGGLGPFTGPGTGIIS